MKPDRKPAFTLCLSVTAALAQACPDGATPHDQHVLGTPTISPSTQSIIYRDVCIIGGGSAGTYSAIRLREMEKSVVVVEQEDMLSGHTVTYTDPMTARPVNSGVIFWHNLDLVKRYFAHFNISLSRV